MQEGALVSMGTPWLISWLIFLSFLMSLFPSQSSLSTYGVGASVLALLLAAARHHNEHHSEEREDGYVLEINLHSCIYVNNNPMDIYNVVIVFSSCGPWGWP